MDPRLTPANSIVACSTLKGKIKHSNFVEGKNYQINVPSVDLLGTPEGKRNRQLIYGSKVKYFDEADGWAFIQNTYDNYVGYVPESTIASETQKSHIITAPLAHVFLEPNIKSKNIEMLPLAAKVSGQIVENGFLEKYNYRNNEVIKSSLKPFFWRAPTDNDLGNGMPERCDVWRNAHDELIMQSLSLIHI